MTERTSVKLTKRAVDALAVSSRDAVVWDRDLAGFGIRVYASGRKVWCVQTRDPGGVLKRVGLGRYGQVTADQARQRASEVIDRIRQGLDPKARPEAEEPTVAELAGRYLESHVRVNCKPATISATEGILRLHIVPCIGGLRLSEVDPARVNELHRGLMDRPTLANRVINVLSGMLRLGESWGMTPPRRNPCRSVRLFQEEPRERFLSKDEYRKLGKALAEAEDKGLVFPSGIAAIRLLLLTGCRKKEILDLKWDDVDRASGEIRLRDGKTGLRHIPLTAAVESVLESIPQKDGNPWVITGLAPGRPLKGLDRMWFRIRDRANLEDVRIHDLRHSWASRGVEIGEGFPMIGKLLGHRDVSTTSRYVHLARDAERASAAKVGGSIGARILPRGEQDGAGR